MLVQAGGLLDDKARALGVGIELLDHRQDVRHARVGRQVVAEAAQSDLGAVAMLSTDIPLRTGVIAHQDGAKPRLYAALSERRRS